MNLHEFSPPRQCEKPDRNGQSNGNRSRAKTGRPYPSLVARHNGSRRRKHILITGGAGFVGTNVAKRLLDDGERVMLFDNLARPGVQANVDWLVKQYGSDVDVYVADVRNERAVRYAVSAATKVYHFAAQVAVTTSLDDPQTDFNINAQGTLNVLEAVRRQADPPPVLFTSTNKVYGSLAQVDLVELKSRYEPSLTQLHQYGIGESQPLDLYSPYGCSKGAADQYMLDYARCFRIPAVVFRMSCIYGPHQCGNEDQGWVAHFALQALRGEPITIYGDGKQVRDVLFVEDLVAAMRLALERIDVTRGRKFNIGGGPQRTTSLVELVKLMEELQQKPIKLRFEPWRVGDQRYYVSDTRAFAAATGWAPQVSVPSGVERLRRWLECNAPVRQRIGSSSTFPASAILESAPIANLSVPS